MYTYFLDIYLYIYNYMMKIDCFGLYRQSYTGFDILAHAQLSKDHRAYFLLTALNKNTIVFPVPRYTFDINLVLNLV